MMEPRPLDSMPGRNALIARCMDFTLRSKAKSQSASDVSSTVPWWTKPAALKSTSTGPSRLAIASIAVVSRASSATHWATPASSRPAMAVSSRSLATTLAPSRAKASAVARPMPLADAVQKASLPLSRSVMRILPRPAALPSTIRWPSAHGHRRRGYWRKWAPVPAKCARRVVRRGPAGAGASPSRGRLEAGGLGLALGAKPALATHLLDAAAVIVGRPGQHVNAALARDQTLDRAAVGRAPLGLVPHLGAELGGALHIACSPDAELGVTRLALEAGIPSE